MLFGETVAVYCENHTKHTDTVRTSQERHHVSVTETNRLMPFKEAAAVYCGIRMEHTGIVRTSQEKHYLSATETNRLMLFKEAATVYCENHTEHTGTMRGRMQKKLGRIVTAACERFVNRHVIALLATQVCVCVWSALRSRSNSLQYFYSSCEQCDGGARRLSPIRRISGPYCIGTGQERHKCHVSFVATRITFRPVSQAKLSENMKICWRAWRYIARIRTRGGVCSASCRGRFKQGNITSYPIARRLGGPRYRYGYSVE
jgi:hypothetical protein